MSFRLLLQRPWSTLALPVALLTLTIRAGPPSALAQEETGVTLHVYANLIQVPVLVLSASRRPLPPLDPEKFGLRLDSGPLFRPTFVRPEGEDPISLAVFVDHNDSQQDLQSRLSEALAALASGPLRPQDHVIVLDLDCHLYLSRSALPITPEHLAHAVDGSLHAATTSSAAGHHARCTEPVYLWDSLAYTVRELSSSPGRRVILAFTNGNDRGSFTNRIVLKDVANRASVSIFAVSDADAAFRANSVHEDYLTELCELTGGMVFHTHVHDLRGMLTDFVTLLRHRYIISFPRPPHMEAGFINLLVTIDKSRTWFIRPGGIGVPLPDPKVLTDPNTIHTEPTHAPELGTRHALPTKP